MNKRILILFAWLWIFKIFHAWSKPPTQAHVDFIALVDAIYAKQTEEVSYEALQAKLWGYYQYPMLLNETSREELTALGILTEIQIDHFFEHLAQNGPFISIYELQSIPEFDLNTIYQLIPFVKIEEVYHHYPKKGLWQKMVHNNYWITRYGRTLEPQKGYKTQTQHGKKPASRYTGSPHKVATRLRIRQPNDFSMGFSAKKNLANFLYGPLLQNAMALFFGLFM